MQKDASISADGLYRHWLSRSWLSLFETEERSMIFCMLNPSTADAEFDDPTIRRCIEFAKREGKNSLLVINLADYRATNPADMMRADRPMSAQNAHVHRESLMTAKASQAHVVCAWGAHPKAYGWGRNFVITANRYKVPLFCLGTTKDGSPRHPLYVKGDQPLQHFC